MKIEPLSSKGTLLFWLHVPLNGGSFKEFNFTLINFNCIWHTTHTNQGSNICFLMYYWSLHYAGKVTIYCHFSFLKQSWFLMINRTIEGSELRPTHNYFLRVQAGCFIYTLRATLSAPANKANLDGVFMRFF